MFPPRVLRCWSAAASLALVAFGFPTPATASPIALFDFNTAPKNNQYTVNGLTLTLSPGYSLQSTYDGDGHVVGEAVGGRFVPYTLGTTDGGTVHSGYDSFVVNRQPSDRFAVTFSERVFSASFDYEIFPNAVDAPPARPDLTVNAYDGTALVFTRRYVGAFPTETGLLRSNVSPKENYAQLLGTDGFAVAGGFTKLEFVDWPVMVGADNLFVSANAPLPPPTPLPPGPVAPVPTPEPASVLAWLLCGGTFGGAALRFKRRRPTVAA